MVPQRPSMPVASLVTTHGLVNVPYSIEPKIGKEVMEFWSGANHPGHDIHVLHDVSGKSSGDIRNLLDTLDKRVTQGMPSEVTGAIDSGEITHIFRTNPALSQSFQDLPQTVQDSLGGPQNTGSIYFRKKTGETARWKLPEIGTNDKGWNANKGHQIFSEATAYTDDTYPITRLNNVSKYVGKPNASHLLEQSLEAELKPYGYGVSKANIQRIKSGNPNLLGSSAVSQSSASTSSAVITQSAPLPSDPSRLISVDATAAAKIESNIAPPVAKKPSNLGKKTDLRTRPNPKGTDIAAPKVTPHGQVKPPTSVREPVTKVTDSTTAASKTQAKVTSQTVASTDDAVQAVTNVKRVSQRGKTLLDNGMDTAKNLASGNARTMGIAGAAALLGVGAFGMRRRSQEDIETKLNRQRYGEMR